MATREPTALEKRVAARIAEKREQRASNTEAYVQEQSTPQGSVLSPTSLGVPSSGKDLRSRPIEGDLKALSKSTSKVASAISTAEAAAKNREFHRARDELGRFVSVKKAGEDMRAGLKTLTSVFKDQSAKIIATLNKNHKEQMRALGSSGSGGFDVFDLLGLGGKGGASTAGKGTPAPKGRLGGWFKGAASRVATAGASAAESVGGLFSSSTRTLVGESVPSAGKAVLGSIRSGYNAAAGLGSTAVDSVSRAIKSPVAGKIMGSIPSILGELVAPAMGAYEAYQAVTDKTKTDSEKAVGVSKAAGGVAGTLAGAAAGATLGSAVPVVGTAIGGVAGGIAGYFGGQKLIDSIGNSVTSALADTGASQALGKGLAVALTPFSEDARRAVKEDWAENMSALDKSLQPLNDTLGSLKDKLKDYSDGVSKATGEITTGVRGAASTMWASVKAAGGQVASGYQKGGIAGAVGSLSTAGTTVKRGASVAVSQVSDAVRLAGSTLGAVSEKYESGGKGVGTVSSGKGDKGGVSYGKYQLATNNNSMTSFLASKEGAAVATQFQGLKPGSKEFNDKYKQLVATPDGAKAMEDAQHGYIQRTHFEPQAAKLKDSIGMDVSKESKGVQEAVWSTSVQYGKDSSVISNALKGKDLSKMTDEEKISAIQDYKRANVQTNFKSSSAEVRDSVARRIDSEKQTLLAVNAAAKGKAAGTIPSSSVSVSQMSGDTSAGTSGPTAARTPSGPSSPQVVYAQAAQKAPRDITVAPTVTASPAPASLVAPSTPPETSRVKVMNQPEPQVAQAETRAQNTVTNNGSSQPTIDEIPLQITDMGLVLLQIGHV